MSPNESDFDFVQTMINDCVSVMNCNNTMFSKFEENFVESIEEFFNERNYLTPKQIEILEQIWGKI